MSIEEYGWLIEFPGSAPAWWDGRGLDTGVLDANDAVRFARQEDAERVASWLIAKHRGYLVTEHGWSDIHQSPDQTLLDAPADPARAIAKMLAKLDADDKQAFNWLIAFSRRDAARHPGAPRREGVS
jgi:hypothetical protein